MRKALLQANQAADTSTLQPSTIFITIFFFISVGVAFFSQLVRFSIPHLTLADRRIKFCCYSLPLQNKTSSRMLQVRFNTLSYHSSCSLISIRNRFLFKYFEAATSCPLHTHINPLLLVIFH